MDERVGAGGVQLLYGAYAPENTDCMETVVVGGMDVVLAIADHHRAHIGGELLYCPSDGHSLLLVLAVEPGADHCGKELA